MRTKPNYSALAKVNGTFRVAPFGVCATPKTEPVAHAIIRGDVVSLYPDLPELSHLPTITVDGNRKRRPTISIEWVSMFTLLNRHLSLPPISEDTVVLFKWDSERQEWRNTFFPVDDTEANAIVQWAQGLQRGVVAGAGDYTL